MDENLIKKDNIVSVIRGAGVVLLFSSFASLLSYISQILFARWLGADDFGIYRFAITWGVVISGLAALGIDRSASRFISQYLHDEATGKLKGLLIGGGLLVTAGAVLLSGLGIAIILLVPDFRDSIYAATIIIILLSVPAVALGNLLRTVIRALRWVLLAELPPTVRPALFLALVTLLQFTSPDLSPEIVAQAFVIAALATVFIQLIILYRKLRSFLRKATITASYKDWLGVSLMIYAGQLFAVGFQKADIILVGLILTSSDVAVYAAAQSTAGMLSLGTVAVMAFARPTIASLYQQQRHKDIQKLLSTMVNLLFWPCLVIVGGLVFYGDFVLSFFGEDFVRGHAVLSILAVGLLFNIGGGLVGVVLNMSGRQAAVTRMWGWAAGANVLVSIVGIYYYGIIGAAIATTMTTVLWNISLNFYCVRTLGFHPSILHPVYKLIMSR